MKSRSAAKRKKSQRSRKTKSLASKKRALLKTKPNATKIKKAPKAKKIKRKTVASRRLRTRPGRIEILRSAAIRLADLPGMSCTNRWRITGYYTPEESDFHGEQEQINISGRGPDTFPSEFLKGVRMEGWGKTRYGWFLGFYSGRYSSADEPQSALGKPLKVGSLAVDKGEIPFGTAVRIPGLPAPWNSQRFVADDVGSMINQ
jgi:membrane-bound lytic murein transglycosylase